MEQKITQNDLIRYIYKETSAAETLAINEALNEDLELQNEHQDLIHAQQQLPKVTFNPSSDTIQNILRYSRHTALETHL